ncbi:hypothetical protein [Pyrobaculum aerophilum]|uniref:Uncharacterized protein n=2 Tax=Pyrobaculum aerophilum TaxID=13773 RepID=A0A371R3Y7_9CREN|nr:hypothetical protein [Pyrobaculum aerophilum]RFA98509.1 hypothetical protein CGL51_00260 [Pyrobaculum aerophilum]
MRGVNKTKRQNKTKGNSQASAPQGGAEAFKAVSAVVNTAAIASTAQPETVQNSEVKATKQEAAPTVEELTNVLRHCFSANCQWLCGQITLSMAPELIMEAFVRALEGALYDSPLKDFKFAVASERCVALVNLVERKYDGVTRITNVKAAKRL